MSLAAGTRLGPYEVVAPLGAGGMGEVYRATDTRLGRTVAIKVLPAELSADPARRQRLEREARAVSTLNHPHICTLHDIGSASSPQVASGQAIFYLVMEFLEGETLAQRLQRAALPIRQAIEIGAQMADALDAAHRRGIVHRDLKPGNVMLTPGGGGRQGSPRVKLLDFGLAKLSEEQPAPPASVAPTRAVDGPLTDPGAAVGTVAYMSPEQATGDDVDARSDLFSLGVVLYEMATRHQPFAGVTAATVFDAILHKVPTPPVRLNPDVPGELERIITKALEKDRDLRYQTAADLRGDLQRLKRDSDSGHGTAVAVPALQEASAPTAKTAGRRRLKWAAAVCVVVAAGSVAAFVVFQRRQPSALTTLLLSNPVKITSASGVENYPSWSPDGRAMAYQSDESGNWDIWVTQVGSKQAVNRTADSPADDCFPTWSPDGQWIAFFSAREGNGYFIMPAVGGKARKVLSWPTGMDYPIAAQWSPDGRQLVCARDQFTRPYLEIVTLEGGAVRQLPLPQRPINNTVLDISWSPDGQWLAYPRALSDIAASSELWLTRVSDGRSYGLTDGRAKDTSPTWSADSREIRFVSTRDGTSELWRFVPGPRGLPEGTPRPATAGLEVLRAVSSPDGSRLALVKGRTIRNVYRAPLLTDRPATWADTLALTSDEADYELIDVSPQGRLVVASDRSGNWDIWTLSSNGGEMEQLTTDPAVDAGPRWKPDGSEVAFHSSRTGHREIWALPAAGGPARQLTRSEEESWNPIWSPDGLEIVAQRTDGLVVFPAQGGPARRVVDYLTGASADWSPDGRWLVYPTIRDGTRQVLRIPASGGSAERISKRLVTTPRWSKDGTLIYGIGLDEDANAIWELSVATKREQPIAALTGRRGRLGTHGLATDGRRVYFLWEESRADIWVADILQR